MMQVSFGLTTIKYCYLIQIIGSQLDGYKVGRVFTTGPKDLGSIPGRVIPKTLKMVLYTSLLNTQQYKVHIKGKVVQSREMSSALPLHHSVVAIEKGAFWSPSTTVTNFTLPTVWFQVFLLNTNNYMV